MLLDEFSKAEKKAAEETRIEKDYYEALARINDIYHVDNEEIIEYDKADELEEISKNLEPDDNINGLDGPISEDIINDVDADINETSDKTELQPVKETDQCMNNKVIAP